MGLVSYTTIPFSVLVFFERGIIISLWTSSAICEPSWQNTWRLNRQPLMAPWTGRKLWRSESQRPDVLGFAWKLWLWKDGELMKMWKFVIDLWRSNSLMMTWCFPLCVGKSPSDSLSSPKLASLRKVSPVKLDSGDAVDFGWYGASFGSQEWSIWD